MSRRSYTINDVDWKWDDDEMRERWLLFAKFGNAPATEITGKNFDKWLKDAGVLNWRHVTPIMTGIAFSKVTGGRKKTLGYTETKEVLLNVAADRASHKSRSSIQEELDFIVQKLQKLQAPSISGATKPQSRGVYDRLTDTSKYTGAHRERFDEDGKGRGKAGRVDIINHTGYVAAYKNQGTYGKHH